MTTVPPPRPYLSPQQMAILKALTTGETTEETAQRLGLSPHMVKNRRRVLYRKLGARNGAHAVGIGLRSGLLQLPGIVR